MHQQRENLDILFRRTVPETVLQEIREGNTLIRSKDSFTVSFDRYADNAYDRYSLLNLSEYSQTEVEMRRQELMGSIERQQVGGIYSLLYLYADEVLHYDGSGLTCRMEEVLNWHSIYLRLGQDLFTTAWLAWHNHLDHPDRMKSHKMTWPAILKTDDTRLNNILRRGLAENHFHLHGSTQNFALSWACLMNHPMKIHSFLNDKPQFNINLNYNASSGSDDNVMDWEERVLYAAMIRALLFECCLGMYDGECSAKELRKKFEKFDLLPLASEAKEHTEMLRYMYGRPFKQLNGRETCLDYANCGQFYQIDENDHNRLLAGERCFLYQCFRRQFRREALGIESNLLYLYLLIKSNFRGELVQINDRYGFQNFADYQDRKNQLFEKYEEYWTESLRLSVCSGIEENYLTSLEARIMPGMSGSAMQDSIQRMDKRVNFSKKGNQSLPYFYVTHFAKIPLKKSEFQDRDLSQLPRNDNVRRKIRQQAKALDCYLHTYDKENQRVCGIDACSMEIGCRPETFATEMRYLRACSRDDIEHPWYCASEGIRCEIGLTYHVGEDFLDIADGLRAIDEAVQFLCMEKGDRIGHGLVLGIDPEEYYQNKRCSIYLRKQDYLDDLVWILYRSLELGVVVKDNDRIWMMDKAMELLNEIYPGLIGDLISGNPLNLYYHSWQLRGDHPDLYLTGEFDTKIKLSQERYDDCKIAGGLWEYDRKSDKLKAYRENRDIVGICCRYHFDTDVKSRGFEVIGVSVEKWYMDLMKDMQQAMRKVIFDKGICIECNPTSNVLIGTFKTYIKHPILSFNNYHLEEDNRHMNMRVSINTDDLGVFDTSLANEYALMFHAICRNRHERGIYNDEAVYEYLEYLRVSGIDMAFGDKENFRRIAVDSNSNSCEQHVAIRDMGFRLM